MGWLLTERQFLKLEAWQDQMLHSCFFFAKPTGSDSVSGLKAHTCSAVKRLVCGVWRCGQMLWKETGSSPGSVVTLLCDSGQVTNPS